MDVYQIIFCNNEVIPVLTKNSNSSCMNGGHNGIPLGQCSVQVMATGIVIMTERKLLVGLKQLAQGCTCVLGNIPRQGPWGKWF